MLNEKEKRKKLFCFSVRLVYCCYGYCLTFAEKDQQHQPLHPPPPPNSGWFTVVMFTVWLLQRQTSNTSPCPPPPPPPPLLSNSSSFTVVMVTAWLLQRQTSSTSPCPLLRRRHRSWSQTHWKRCSSGRKSMGMPTRNWPWDITSCKPANMWVTSFNPFTPNCTFWRGRMTTQFRATFWETCGVLSHDQWCNCWRRSLLAVGTVFIVFLNPKTHLSWTNCWVFNVDQISTPEWQHGSSLQMKRFVLLWIFWVMELKAMKKTCLERKDMLMLTQLLSVVVTVAFQKNLLRRWINPVDLGIGVWSQEKNVMCNGG